jgi:hypothetical protein
MCWNNQTRVMTPLHLIFQENTLQSYESCGDGEYAVQNGWKYSSKGQWDTININKTRPETSREALVVQSCVQACSEFRSGLMRYWGRYRAQGASLPHFFTSRPDWYSSRSRNKHWQHYCQIKRGLQGYCTYSRSKTTTGHNLNYRELSPSHFCIATP